MPRNYQSFTPMIGLRALPRFSAITLGWTVFALCGVCRRRTRRLRVGDRVQIGDVDIEVRGSCGCT